MQPYLQSSTTVHLHYTAARLALNMNKRCFLLKVCTLKSLFMSLLWRTNTYFILKPNTGGRWVWQVCFAVGVVSPHCLPSQPEQLIPLYQLFSPAAVLSPPRHTVHVSGSLRSISDHRSTFLSSLYILDNLY